LKLPGSPETGTIGSLKAEKGWGLSWETKTEVRPGLMVGFAPHGIFTIIYIMRI
jgi:hypothetical protein